MNGPDSAISIQPDPALDTRRTIAIPDLHGDLDALWRSLRAAKVVDKTGKWIGEDSILVTLGDYMDRGIEGLEILHYLVNLRTQIQAAGGALHALIGNHEAYILDLLRRFEHQDPDLEEAYKKWTIERNGGASTLEGIGVKARSTMIEGMQKLKESGLKELLQNNLTLAVQVGTWLFVHGGLNVQWAEEIQKKGLESMNATFKADLVNQKASENWRSCTGKGGPLWTTLKEMEALTQEEKQAMVAALKSRGISGMVVGHTPIEDFKILEGFSSHGLVIVPTDLEIGNSFNDDTYAYLDIPNPTQTQATFYSNFFPDGVVIERTEMGWLSKP